MTLNIDHEGVASLCVFLDNNVVHRQLSTCICYMLAMLGKINIQFLLVRLTYNFSTYP